MDAMRFPRAWRVWASAFAALVLTTAGLHAFRGDLQQAHVVLVYLLVVLAGSAYGGRALGFVLAVLGFVSIDYFFQSPFDRLSVDDPLDWFILIAFLITAAIAANLLARAQMAAEIARDRTDEVARLSQLGAELLGTGTAETALAAIVNKVRETTNAETAVVFHRVGSGSEQDLETLAMCGERSDITKSDALNSMMRGEILAISAAGDIHTSFAEVGGVGHMRKPVNDPIRKLMVPLRIHDRVVGVLGIGGDSQLRLDEDSRPLLHALSYYAALAVERVSLVAQAEHAEALRERVRVREALLASVSHDLRTPLSTIKLLAQDLVNRRDVDVASANAMVIEEQADRLSGMVNNILDLTRIRSSAFPVYPEVNAAEDLVGAVARQVTGILGIHELVRQINQAGPVLLGKFDFVQSQRILANLIENAVRYSPRDAPIVFCTSRVDDALVLSISDSGPGVPVTERELIFEPFYRRPSAVADIGGVGLGLYIGRALAEAQGGSLSYLPRPEGGSVFVLRLPADDGTSSAADTELLEEGA